MAGVLDLPTLVQKVRLNSDTAQAERDTQSAMTRIGSSMTKIGAGMTAAVTVPIIGLAAAGVNAASDLAESSSKVGVVFEENAGKVRAFAETAAESLGMSEQKALEAAGTFGNLFRALGVTTDEAAEMSTSLVTLAADLASFNNVDPEEALLALRSGLLGEAEPLRRFGVSLSAARIEAEAMASGIVQATGDTTKITDATLKFEAAQKKLAEAQSGTADPEKLAAAEKAVASARDGAAKATLDLQAAERAVAEAKAKNGIGSAQAVKAEDALAKKRIAADAAARKLTESQAKLAAAQSGGKADADELAKLTNDVAKAEEALGKATAGTVPELTAAQKAQAAYAIIQKDTALALGDFERTSDGLANQQRILAAQFEDAKAGLGQVFLPLVQRAVQFVNELLGAFKGLSPEAQKMVGIAAGIAAAIGPLLIVVGQLAKSFTAIKTVVSGAGLLGLGPLLPVVLAVAAAGVLIWKNWDKIRPTFEKVRDAVVPLVKEGFAALSRAWDTLRTGMTENDVAEPLEKVALVIRNNILPVVSTVVDFVKRNWKPVVIGAFIALAGPITSIVALFAVLYTRFEGVRNAVGAVARFIVGTVVPAVVTFGQTVARYVGNVIDYFRSIAPQVQEALGHVMAVLKVVFGVVKEIIQVALGVLAALWRAWGDDLFNILKAVWKVIQEVIRGALGVVKGIIQTVLAVINGDWGKAWDGLKAIVDGVWDAIFGVLRGAKDIVSSIFGGIASTVGEVWNGMWEGIKGAASAAWRFVAEKVLNPMIEGINSAIDGLNIINPFGDVKKIPLIQVAAEPPPSSPGLVRGGNVRAAALGGAFNAGDFGLTGERGPELEFKRHPSSVLSASRLEGLLRELVTAGPTRVGGDTYRVEVVTVDRPSGQRLGRDIAWGLTQARGRPLPAGTGA